MDLLEAAKAHSQWKVRLMTAINKKEQMDVNMVASDHDCPLGQWLHGDAKAKYSGLRSFKNCVSAHAHFHEEAGKIASQINQGQYAAATELLDGGSHYSLASTTVAEAIRALKAEAQL